ncbi:transglutaminase-like domain-containing protein [Actinocrispum wychmicini]|uniref:Transglutaminase-like putative cysteine protease n=1 Tax=Actinocrispum wychmicini TaxID=1213861 RepID=A0A4R2JEB3_9PSEU|nr:transglutaminase family protein [Actinocrispum wychmicini]TCO57324.1 transglutaminase-like putative cysteine protease [Actinocrispum wychmicini]
MTYERSRFARAAALARYAEQARHPQARLAATDDDVPSSAAMTARNRWLRIGCAFDYRAEIETPTVFLVRPSDGGDVRAAGEQWSAQPEMPMRRYRDLYGNQCVRVVLPAGRSSLRYQAFAEVPDVADEVPLEAAEVRPDELPDRLLLYTLPSRYCLPDALGDEAWSRFGSAAPGYGRVRQICSYVHDHLTFRYGSSTAMSTAVDVNASGFGVCRDFTHLAISFCRALNIPARYVFGYLPDMDVHPDPAPMDFAAWMEVWLAGRWWTVDPRNNSHRKGRVPVGRGRDAADVAMATTFGGPHLEAMRVIAEECDRPG